MNNVVLGSERFTYYETIAGGQGACPDADGPSAVHVAMTNTLNTPVEALELAYPLRVERYALRLGSGGAGAHRGGDGVVRELRALEPCRLSIVSQRRSTAPRGAQGGRAGRSGPQPPERRAAARERVARSRSPATSCGSRRRAAEASARLDAVRRSAYPCVEHTFDPDRWRDEMLTGRQQEIWDYVVDYVDAHGYPPTVREIGEAVGLASPSTVHAHLANLERAGLLRRDPPSLARSSSSAASGAPRRRRRETRTGCRSSATSPPAARCSPSRTSRST